MIANDFRIAVKNIMHNKVTSAISILGLGIGLGSIILLVTLVVHETSFDKFIPDYRNVYKVTFGTYDFSQYPLAEELKKDFPGIKDFFRINQANNVQVRNTGNEYGRNQEFAFADASIFKILGIKIISGTPANTTSEVAISEKTAKKFFGNSLALGQVLKVKLNTEFIDLFVTGVYKDFPPNSTLYPDYIADIKLSAILFGQWKSHIGEYGQGPEITLNWDLLAFYTYLVLDKNTDKQALISNMQKYAGMSKYESTRKLKYDLQPVSDIYFKSGGYLHGFNFFRAGNSNELKYYWTIGFFILIISVTNYIFLARAATSDRLRALGTRKVMGASPLYLQRQIILEANLMTLLSLIPALFIIDTGITLINNTLNKTLSLGVFSSPVTWVFIILILIITGTVSGLVIGYRISRISPLLLISGKTSERSGSNIWNYSFLIFHFSVYIILIASVFAVTKQIKYTTSGIKGLNPDNILISELYTTKLQAGFETFCGEMKKIPGVLKVAGSSNIPLYSDPMPVTLTNPDGENMRFEGLIVGEGMTELLNIEMLEGSPFGNYQSTGREVIFNESAAKKYNIKTGEKYLGQYHVGGIVRDFHSHSLHTSIEPMIIIQQNPAKMGLLAIKTDGKNDKAVIERLNELYTQIDPEEIFDVKYLTDVSRELYTHEKNQAEIMGAFSLLATVLAVMGLFGIALITITRKTKEIGLRKVNGASIPEILYLLNKDLVRWVLVSLIIGIPVSLYLMAHWQTHFAYKTELNWWIFAIAGGSAILVTLLTVSWQSFRAAAKNPVEALRYE